MGVPKWLQSIANATIRASIADAPAVTTASGYTINSKTGEVTQDATDDPGVKQLRDNLAVLGGTATGITTAPVVGAVVSNPVAQKLIGDAAASMLGGEVVDKTHRALTGQSFGRGVASIFGQQNVYDRSALARFGYDALNPGYFLGGLVQKGLSIPFGGLQKFKLTPSGNINIKPAENVGDKAPIEYLRITSSTKPQKWGAESDVWPLEDIVLKRSKQFVDVPTAKKQIGWMNFKNQYPGFLKQTYVGYSAKSPQQAKLYFTQPKVKVINDDIINLLLPHRMKKLGYQRLRGSGLFSDGIYVDTKTGYGLYDVGSRNVGTLNDKFYIIDAMPTDKTFTVTPNPNYIKPEINLQGSILGNIIDKNPQQ